MRSHSRLRCAGRNAAQILTQLFKCKYNYKYSFTSDITNKGSTPFLQAQIQHAPILSPLFQILFHVQQATYYEECTDKTTNGWPFRIKDVKFAFLAMWKCFVPWKEAKNVAKKGPQGRKGSPNNWLKVTRTFKWTLCPIETRYYQGLSSP